MDLSTDSKRILFWVPGGMPLLLHVEGAIAKALMLRGHTVFAVICDGVYKACILRNVKVSAPVKNWGETGTSEHGYSCKECKRINAEVLKSFNVPFGYISDFVSDERRLNLYNEAGNITWSNLSDLNYKNINVGLNAKSSIVRYLQGINNNPDEDIVREYAYSALISACASETAIFSFKPDRIFTSHGIYIEYGPIVRLSLAKGIQITIWSSCYLKSHFYFNNVDSINRTGAYFLSDRGWHFKKLEELTTKRQQRLDEYIHSRYLKLRSFDIKEMTTYGRTTKETLGSVINQQGKNWVIFCHLSYDGSIDGLPMPFESFEEWVIQTLVKIHEIKDVNWIVKVHPSEKWHGAAKGVADIIKEGFFELPSHIKLVGANANINTLGLLKSVDGCVTITSTAGLELAYLGKPVILAGESYYSNKGFTYDGFTLQEYNRLLEKAVDLPPLSKTQQELANKFMYCHFIERQIPLEIVDNPHDNFWHLQPHKMHLLHPGRDPFVDFICDRIIDGKDFIMDEDLVERALRFQEGQTYKRATVINEFIKAEKIEELTSLFSQLSSAIEASNVSLALSIIKQILEQYETLLDEKQKTDLIETYSTLQSIISENNGSE